MSETSKNQGTTVAAPQDADGMAEEDPGPSLQILIEFDQWRVLNDAEDAVRRAYDACANREPALRDREVTVLLSSDDAVAALNKTYRGYDRPTNVLSFPAAGPYPHGTEPLGDIIIAYQTVMREADADHKAPLAHLSHLTVHGLLHLAGYDHDNDSEAEHMEEMERTILADIGISDPYQTVEDKAPILAH